MRERPILFSGEMVRAILDGRKTQTRRILRDDWKPGVDRHWLAQVQQRAWEISPYGEPGDRIWVRETWREDPFGGTYYRATGVDAGVTDMAWRPSIFMKRDRCRLLLEVTGIRVERLQDISEEDARAEGVDALDGVLHDVDLCRMAKVLGEPATESRVWFATLWGAINGKRADWAINPWVWVVSFKRVTRADRGR